MPKKVPIRILRKRFAGVGGFKPQRPDSYYVQNRTVADITSEGTLEVFSGDIPGTTISGEFSVLDRYGEPRIKVGSEEFFIRKDDTAQVGEVLDTFEFYINPQRITPTYRKLITETRTRGGWEVQHWGEALTEIRVTGKSGGMHRLDRTLPSDPGQVGQTLQEAESITDSLAWKRLMQLKKFYDEDHQIKNREDLIMLEMNYYDKTYIGYFVDFVGPEADAEVPYQVNYGFTFKVQEERSL